MKCPNCDGKGYESLSHGNRMDYLYCLGTGKYDVYLLPVQ